ncbi:hypothetical protein PIB30_027481 [Stylosanthes scabra]|uniref:KIB1-4 beta-propeller domain-containing protein n=1 Tax=Stylosanthes scabra TaxID=79078 RepID=A0ABU6QA52_9FABA|nr:hypothetical protein [Stylosanthes scabra]
MENLMNCRATCRSWRKVAEAVFSSQLPLMLSLSPSKYFLSAPLIYHDFSVVTETWPQITNRSDEIISLQSVQGWLMFNEFHSQSFCELSFFNPFSRATFKLPKLFLFPRSLMMNNCRVRLVFNSAPPGSDEFVVVLLCGSRYDHGKMRQKIAFFKFKQGSLIVVSESILEYNEYFYDIAVDDDDKLYALTSKHNTILSGISFSGTQRLAMDTSTGELLLVLYYESSPVPSGCLGSSFDHTEQFHVYKLERSSLIWCEVVNIGDRFLLWDSTRHPLSGNRCPKLLPSSLSFMFNSPFFQFSGNFSDDYFRHYIHQNVPLSVTIPTVQIASQTAAGRALTLHRKFQCSSSFSSISRSFSKRLIIFNQSTRLRHVIDPQLPSRIFSSHQISSCKSTATIPQPITWIRASPGPTRPGPAPNRPDPVQFRPNTNTSQIPTQTDPWNNPTRGLPNLVVPNRPKVLPGPGFYLLNPVREPAPLSAPEPDPFFIRFSRVTRPACFTQPDPLPSLLPAHC